jgi:cysteine-rich repeat protein
LQSLAAAVPEIGKRFGIAEQEFNCDLWRGSYTIMLRVSGYNGQPDDASVRVDLYISPGLIVDRPWECPVENFATTYPLWRAALPWGVDPDTLTGPITQEGALPPSKVGDAQAYVRNGYLVARFPDDSLVRFAASGARFRGFAMKVQKSVWSGKLSLGQDNVWKIKDGMFGGRVRSSDLIQSFRQIGLCPGSGLDPFYKDLVQYIQQEADVTADGTDDPQRDCDAISLGIAFEASQLTPGPLASATSIVECCAPGTTIEDCNAECGDGRKNGKEKCDTAIADGQPGVCPKSCASKDACTPQKLTGTGCDMECIPTPITAVGAQDNCCPKGADATIDRDCAAVCGNNIVEKGETCDPAGSCPNCKPEDKCLRVTSTGSADGCNLSCSFTALSGCENDDGCCPLNCTSSNDNDCSASCGDGRVESAAHETCEPDADAKCPANCDDGNNCTQDLMTGSVKTCNVTCTHVPITQAVSGDKCCPAGVSANFDTDCQAMCGNKKVEGSEQCDDGNMQTGDGCTADCKTESDVDRCIAQLGTDWRPECARCFCEKCRNEVLACYAGKEAAQNTQCTDYVTCSLEKGCSSTNCYCGSSSLSSCLLGLGNGGCRQETEAAAQTTAPGDISARSGDNNFPLGRANNLAACVRTNCPAECDLK